MNMRRWRGAWLSALLLGGCGGGASQRSDGAATDARRSDGGDGPLDRSIDSGADAPRDIVAVDAVRNGDAQGVDAVSGAEPGPSDGPTDATTDVPAEAPLPNDAASVDTRDASEAPAHDASDAHGVDAAPDGGPSPDAGEVGAQPYDGSGALSWVQRSRGNGADQIFGLAVTTSEALVVGGHYNGAITFAPDSSAPVSFSSKGEDLYLTRSTGQGALTWARTAGTTVQNVVSAVGAAPNDDVFVGGTCFASATDPLVLGAGEPNQTTFTGIGTFFARYHADGTLAWAKLEKNGGEPWRVFAAPDGGMFAMGSVGSFYATFGVGEPHETTLINRTVSVSTPTFLARFDVNGQLAWVRTMGGTDPDAALMADGGVVVVAMAGPMMAALQGGAGPDTTISTDLYDTFIASYSGAGDLRWVKQIKGLPQADPLAVTVLGSGDIVVTGSLEPDQDGTPQQGDAAHTQAVFGPGEANETKLSCSNFDLYLARYPPMGALVWAKTVPTAYPEIRGLASLADGGFVLASRFQDEAPAVVFDPGSAGSISVPRLAQYGDVLVSWHHGDGTARAARMFATGAPRVLGISVLSDGSTVLAGAFSDTTTFGPLDAAKVSFTKTGGGYENIVGEDMFLARLKP